MSLTILDFFKKSATKSISDVSLANHEHKLKGKGADADTTKSVDITATQLSQGSLDPSGKEVVACLYDLLVDVHWKRALSSEFRKSYMIQIAKFLQEQNVKNIKVFPSSDLIFNAFNLTSLNDIKVVIIGQDPYHNINQAHGLCFSVMKGVLPPPSLMNIYKVIGKLIGTESRYENFSISQSWMFGELGPSRAHKANSHSHIGWQTFTNEVIRIISSQLAGVVFMLWGGFAQKKESLIDHKKHSVIKTAHPSPLSAHKFLGCRCFSRANQLLSKSRKGQIDWCTI